MALDNKLPFFTSNEKSILVYKYKNGIPIVEMVWIKGFLFEFLKSHMPYLPVQLTRLLMSLRFTLLSNVLGKYFHFLPFSLSLCQEFCILFVITFVVHFYDILQFNILRFKSPFRPRRLRVNGIIFLNCWLVFTFMKKKKKKSGDKPDQ